MFTTTTPPRRPTKRERANIDRIRFQLRLDLPAPASTSPDGLTARQRRAQRNGWTSRTTPDQETRS